MEKEKKEKVSQKTLLLDYLRQYGSIEPLTALRELGIYRLSARIADLREDGANIMTERVMSISKFTGEPVYFARYNLVT